MEVSDIVIVGAGIAGLSTSLGLHRSGIRSLVLESADSLRVTGFAFTTWTNAWKALDALGIGDSLRQQHLRLEGIVVGSLVSGLPVSEMSYDAKAKHGEHEVRCVKRKLLLEALASELPSGTIRFSSKVVSIEKSGHFKLLHLTDGTIVKSKVLIGCDGINSVVAKWLGFGNPAPTGRSAIRGYADYRYNHGFGSKSMHFYGNGVRTGCHPCDDESIYWFFTYTPSSKEKEVEEDPIKMKQYVLSNAGRIPDKMRSVIENTELCSLTASPLRYRHPWELLWGNICKDSVCIAGDALHPMTPDLGQGGCVALEDGVVLARCLAQALLEKPRKGATTNGVEEESGRIKRALENYAKERKWRSFDIIAAAYIVGRIQQSDGKMMSFFRENVIGAFLAGLLLKKADFDCGKLYNY